MGEKYQLRNGRCWLESSNNGDIFYIYVGSFILQSSKELYKLNKLIQKLHIRIILFSTETPPVLVQNMTAIQLNSAVVCNSSGQNITGPLEMAVKVNGSQHLCSRALLKTVPLMKTARAFFFFKLQMIKISVLHLSLPLLQ